MRKILILCAAAVVSVACNQPLLEEDVMNPEVCGEIIFNPPITPPIIFNPFTGNPYAVSMMRDAFLELQESGGLPSDADVDDYVYTSHLYIKFSPESEEQIAQLQADSTMILYPYPIDNETSGTNDEYTVRPEEGDTTTVHFYTAVPSSKVLPTGIPYTILEELYIPDECSGNNASPSMKTVSGEDISENVINTLVDKSYQLAGDITFIGPLNNTPGAEPMSNQYTELWRPSGRITAYDDIVDGQVPLQGIEVRARRWFTTYKGVTDADGEFVCDGRFKRPAVYSFRWEGERWDIRDGMFIPANYNGPKRVGEWNLEISGGKSLSYSAIYRAAHRWYDGNIQGLTRPGNIRKEIISYFHSSHPDKNGDYNIILDSTDFLFDIRVWGKESGTNEIRCVSRIYKTACHELGHAAHYTNANENFRDADTLVKESWARCVEYLLTNQEYSEREAFDRLYATDTIRVQQIIDNHVYEYETYWIVPDYFYNYQAMRTPFQSDYTPLFIDLVDGFNQYEYYQVKLTDIPTENESNSINSTMPVFSSIYPIDRINNMPPNLVEDIIFSNTSVGDIKTALIQYVQSNPVEAAGYNLTEQNINQLFYNYGY